MEEKIHLIQQLKSLLDERIYFAQKALETIRESKTKETKSSVGDKFETGRAMLQREEDKNYIQWSLLKELKLKLSTIQLQRNSIVGFGSLVTTNEGKYFIAIGIGKFKVAKQIYFVISPDSPIGKLLIGKLEGDYITFNKKKMEILKIE